MSDKLRLTGLMSKSYYPPGTAPYMRMVDRDRHPEAVGQCRHPNDSPHLDQHYPGGCKLLAGHEGEHNYSANWSGHVEVTVTNSTTAEWIGDEIWVDIEVQNWHGYSNLKVKSRAEADALLAFLAGTFDEAYPSPELGKP